MLSTSLTHDKLLDASEFFVNLQYLLILNITMAVHVIICFLKLDPRQIQLVVSVMYN
jgi:hypothetical protein